MTDELETLEEYFNSKAPIQLGNPLSPMGEFPLINAKDVIVDYDSTEKKPITLDAKLSNIVNEVLSKLPYAEEVSV